MNERVLVVETNPLLLDFLADGLSARGYVVFKAHSLHGSFPEIQKSQPHIILADYQLRDGKAFSLIAWLKEHDIRIPIVVLTDHASVELGVEAIKQGAERFIPKPVDLEFLASELRRTLDSCRHLQRDIASKLEKIRYERDPFLGNSPAIQALKKTALRFARSNGTLLLEGETGTGKGVLARWLFKMGSRSREAFIDLNCAALSRDLLESELFGHKKGSFTGAMSDKIGLVEAADHGTLFLDEIGELDPQIQPKILKVVEDKLFYRLGEVSERKVDVQIIAATHRDLKSQAENGTFRKDLYFRVSALQMRIPPLRERLEDIPIITDRLLEQLGKDMQRFPLSISDRARVALQQYSWPGNIRELRNVLERAVLLSEDGVIDRTGIEFESVGRAESSAITIDKGLTLEQMEKRYIAQVLESENGNVTRASNRLGISRSSLYLKIREARIVECIKRVS